MRKETDQFVSSIGQQLDAILSPPDETGADNSIISLLTARAGSLFSSARKWVYSNLISCIGALCLKLSTHIPIKKNQQQKNQEVIKNSVKIRRY